MASSGRLWKPASAAVGTALATVGAAFASFLSDETTAESCETVVEYYISIDPMKNYRICMDMVATRTCKSSPFGQQAMDKDCREEGRERRLWYEVDLPSFQASAIFLLPHDDLLGWALLVLHLINSIMSASCLLPNRVLSSYLPSNTCPNARDGILGAKSPKATTVRSSSVWETYRRTLVVSTILLGRIALLRRVAAAVA